MDIISAYREVGTYRGAAEMCGTTHKTVRRVVQRFEAGDPPPDRPPRPHNYDEVVELVAGRIDKSHGKISAKRLLPIARAAGYTGSDRNFRRLVSDEKAKWRNNNHRAHRPAVWTPGEYLVIDWATVGAGLHLFCAVLAYSRWRFVAFATNERATTTLELIAAALTAVGGVPAKVLADRMGCLKAGVVANVVVPTPDYVRLATHYGFRPDFCHAHDPESKGLVEHLVGYAKNDLVVPLLTDADVAGTPIDVHIANHAARVWCAEVNAAVHAEICAIPHERLLIERRVLAALPSLQVQIGPAPVTRKVDKLSCIRFASARYSVPTRLIGTTVTVAPDGGRLLIVDPATAEIVAEHDLGAPGTASILDEHYPQPRRAPSRGPRPKTDSEQQFCALGDPAEQFLVGAAAIGNTRLAAEIDTLLALTSAHGTDAVVAALDRAVQFGRFRAEDVRSILDAGTGLPRPQPPGEALTVDLPTAPTRSLEAYAFGEILR